ncbi:MAG: AraC family transcriptional regulator [Hahellaceae bacterium]|nr:AraC family transcriptional regulator [Hahellaceae bacterium]
MTEAEQGLPPEQQIIPVEPRPLFAFSKVQASLTDQVVNGLSHYLDSITVSAIDVLKEDSNPGGYLAYVSFKHAEVCYFSLNNGDTIELSVLDNCSLAMLMPAHRNKNNPAIDRAIGQPITWLCPGDRARLCGESHEDYLLISFYGLPKKPLDTPLPLQEPYFEHNLSRYCLMILIQSLYQSNFKSAVDLVNGFERQLATFIDAQIRGLKISFNGHIPASTTPTSLERAEDFMLKQPNWEYCIQTLSKVSEQSPRTLYYQFQRYRGMTPYRYHTLLKLYRARILLTSDAAPDESIAFHATNCGFYHLGRFSALYNETFGELPRRTRDRRQKLNGKHTFVLPI